MYFETIREQPTPPPIKGVKIELNILETKTLYSMLAYTRSGMNIQQDQLRIELLANLEGALTGRT